MADAPTSVDAAEQRRAAEREAVRRSAQERDAFVPRPVAAADAAASAPAALPAGESPCFPIHQLHWRGADPAAFPGLIEALSGPGAVDAPVLPRCLGAQGVGLLLKRAQDALIAAGFVTTRVLAEPQDLRSGELTLTLMPGRLRVTRFSEASSPRATAWNAVPIRPGQVLNLRDIEQGLDNFKRLPTVDAAIRIAPAEQPGESDLLIDWQQGFPLRLAATLDDSGGRGTGKYQGELTLSADHWLALNDLFYASVSHDLGGGDADARGTRGLTLHHSLPLGHWLLSTTASASRFAQNVAGASQNYSYRGSSRQMELQLARTLQRDATSKTSAHVQAFVRASSNFIDDTEVEVQRRRVGGWAVGINHHVDQGHRTLDLAVDHKHGTGAFGALPAPEQAFGEGTSRFALFTASAALTQGFEHAGRSWTYSGQLRAQLNRTPLVPQDRFAIGGRYTVRGFDGEATLSAERGWLLRNEWSTQLGSSAQQWFVGLDHGAVGGPSAGSLAGRHLTGAVTGVRGALGPVQFEVFAGAPLWKPAGMSSAGLSTGVRFSVALGASPGGVAQAPAATAP
ncbi:MAG: Hemolysin transporter protein ShlB precursor [Pseudomonadota bacterium]|jgi:hemolysin activation/secretion protein